MNPAQLWALGDYATVGDRWAGAGVSLVNRVVRPGDRVLDIATGVGVVAIAAARAGATVTGLDVAPTLLAEARRRAGELSVRWVEADMTATGQPDGGYDRVLSAFGAMFAPEPTAMAAELVRLVRPGGTIALCAWRPDSPFGQLRPLLAAHMPGLAAGPRVEDWGDPQRVTGFFSGQPVRMNTVADVLDVRWPSLDQAVTEITTLTPGMVAARAAIEPLDRWELACQQVHEMFAAAGRTDEGGFTLPVGYLTAIGDRL